MYMADNTTEVKVKLDSGDFLPRLEALTKRLEAAQDLRAIRLECLKMVVANGPSRSVQDQQNEAQQYLDWVMQTEAESAPETQGGDGGAAFAKEMEAVAQGRKDHTTPEEVLRENGWTEFVGYYLNKAHPGIQICVNSQGIHIGPTEKYIEFATTWDSNESTFPQWLTANLALLMTAEAAKEVEPMEPINFLKSVITYPEMSDFHQEKGMVYFTWCEARYRFNPETNEVALMHNGGITDSPASILMTALVKLAAGAGKGIKTEA